MKLFECQNCGQPLYFENTRCESCELALGYLPARQTMTALKPERQNWRALASPRGDFRYCANAAHGACNWMIPAGDPEQFCAACRHNRMIPDLTQADNLAHWRLIEVAKHRLFYTLLRLRLPLRTRLEDPDGLAFDFLADGAAMPSGAGPVMTGHASGVITINLAEADDAERERRRGQMGEPYRTLLGHFRHEIAHYCWDRLIARTASLDGFRHIFGDEREDYGSALQRYYASGAPADWPTHFVTAYATAHPWEDFAETWAHYFHIVDTLEMARAFGVDIHPRLDIGEELETHIDFQPYRARSIAQLVDAWLPLTFALNSINRSMGQPDLYPFILTPAIVEKLGFIHRICGAKTHTASPTGPAFPIQENARTTPPEPALP
jgi:hypothetical protein